VPSYWHTTTHKDTKRLNGRFNKKWPVTVKSVSAPEQPLHVSMAAFGLLL
jgi:hypothetical protein